LEFFIRITEIIRQNVSSVKKKINISETQILQPSI